MVPKDRLLEYEVKEGWEPLCQFLGKEVPLDEGFPNVNDTENFLKWHGKLWLYAVLHALVNVVGVILSVVIVGVAWYLYRSG